MTNVNVKFGITKRLHQASFFVLHDVTLINIMCNIKKLVIAILHWKHTKSCDKRTYVTVEGY